MATQGGKLFGEHYDRDHPAHDEVLDPGVRSVKGDGGPVSQEELRSQVFRFANRAAGGSLVKSIEETGQSTAPTSPQRP